MRYSEETFIRAAVNGASSEQLVQMVEQYAEDPRGVPCMEMFRAARLGPFGFSDRERRRYIGLDSNLSDPAVESYLDTGWSNATEDGARWTLGSRAVVHFALEPGVDHQLTIELRPFLVPGQVDCQLVGVELNGSEVASLRLDRPEWIRHTISLPERLVGRVNSVSLQFSDAACGERQLGAYVRWLRIE